MHYAIQFEQKHSDFLSMTARKPTLKHQLISVEDGLISIRLGKQEYAVAQGDTFWLPANCLSSISYFPHTTCRIVEASQRLTQPFPHQAGYIKPNSLMQALLERLTSVSGLSEHQQVLLTALQYELLQIKPNLQTTSLSQQLNDWNSPKQQKLPAEYQMVMRIKQAEKLRLSGKKDEQIAEALFGGSTQSYLVAKQAIMGE